MATTPALAADSTHTPHGVPRDLRRLFGLIGPTNVALYLAVGAVPAVLLPTQVTALDPAHDVANLAIITGSGAVAAMIASPVAGIISDRTRSRFGRRTPMMVLGALAAGLALIALGLQNTIVQLAITWAIVQTALNLVISPLTAILPDRVPERVRGGFAALFGAGMMLGGLAGQIVASRFVGDLVTGYFLLAGVLVTGIILFVVLVPDASSLDRPKERLGLRALLRTFWVDPVAHPDFFWGFLGRMLMYTGFFLVSGYQLYVLRDYIGLGADAAGAIPLLGAVSIGSILLTTAISGPISDRVGRRRIFVFLAAVLIAAALMAPLLLPTFTGMIVYSLVAGLGFGIFQSVDTALMSQVLPSASSYSKDLGVLNIVATLPQTISPFLGGAIVLTAGYSGIFPIGMVLALLGGVAVFMIKSVR